MVGRKLAKHTKNRRLGSRIECFYVDRRAKTTILFSHANAEDVATVFAWLRNLSMRLQARGRRGGVCSNSSTRASREAAFPCRTSSTRVEEATLKMDYR